MPFIYYYYYYACNIRFCARACVYVCDHVVYIIEDNCQSNAHEKYGSDGTRPSAFFRSHCNATCLIDHRGGGGYGGRFEFETSNIGKPTARQRRKISPSPRHRPDRVVVPLSDRLQGSFDVRTYILLFIYKYYM